MDGRTGRTHYTRRPRPAKGPDGRSAVRPGDPRVVAARIALVAVGAVVLPLWQFGRTAESRAAFIARWTPERLGKLLLGPNRSLLRLLHLGQPHPSESLSRSPRQRGHSTSTSFRWKKGPHPARGREAVRAESGRGRRQVGPYVLANMIRVG